MPLFMWNPDPYAFVIPYVDYPIRWYGVLFACGFVICYFFLRKAYGLLMQAQHLSCLESIEGAHKLADKTLDFSVIGMLLGARLGHVLFYDWAYYRLHPVDIIKFWEGGLASHGAVLGILIAFMLLVRRMRAVYPWLTLWIILDILVAPVALTGGGVRIGNFINQEITGKPTALPWGIFFGNPVDGPVGVPLHPVQLYEALSYFLIAGSLFWLWHKKRQRIGSGFLTGTFFVLVFTARFGFEFLKNPQNTWFDTHVLLTMGQVLSLPCIGLGIWLIYRAYRMKQEADPVTP